MTQYLMLVDALQSFLTTYIEDDTKTLSGTKMHNPYTHSLYYRWAQYLIFNKNIRFTWNLSAYENTLKHIKKEMREFKRTKIGMRR